MFWCLHMERDSVAFLLLLVFFFVFAMVEWLWELDELIDFISPLFLVATIGYIILFNLLLKG